MANYAHVKDRIAANVYTNHDGQVTAENVKTAINEVVDTIIAGGYLYAGVAKLTPTQTNPGSPDANVFYIATEPGTYTNFVGAGGSLVVADGEVAIFKYNGTWSKEVTGTATAAQVTELGQEMTQTKEFLGILKYIDGPFVNGKLLDADGKMLSVSALWDATTDFIQVNEGQIIEALLGAPTNRGAIAFYSSADETTCVRCVAGKGHDKLYEFREVVGNNENYVRFSRKAALSSIIAVCKSTSRVVPVNNLIEGGIERPLSAEQGKILKGLITPLLEGYEFMGFLNTSSVLPEPTHRVFYLGPAGTYNQFTPAFTVADNRFAVIRFDGENWNPSSVIATSVIDNLISSRTASALSANQGKVLKGLIDTLDVQAKDLSNISKVVSNPTNEYMTQCPSAQYSEGYMFVAYYNNPTIKVEGPYGSTFVKLSKFNICRPEDATFIDVLKSGQTVGDITLGDYAIYDPIIFIKESTIYALLIATDSNDNSNRGYFCRTINKDTLELGNTLSKLQFRYAYNGQTYSVDMFEDELSTYLDRRMGRTAGESVFGRPALSQPVYYDGYYYTFLAGATSNGKGFPGVLIKSADGVTWDEVSCPTNFVTDYGITDIGEGAIEIVNGVVYLSIRASRCPLFTYTISSGVWSSPTYPFAVNVYQGARNFIYKRGNYIYLFANCYPELTTAAGDVMRSRMRVFKYDTSLSLIGSIDITSRFGLVYPNVLAASAGEYIVCAENRRWPYTQQTGDINDPNYPCSDIGLIQIAALLDTL